MFLVFYAALAVINQPRRRRLLVYLRGRGLAGSPRRCDRLFSYFLSAMGDGQRQRVSRRARARRARVRRAALARGLYL